MPDLHITSGLTARDSLCAEFDAARHSIVAEFYSIWDRDVVASLNAAANRGVDVRLEIEGAPDRYDRTQDPQAADKTISRLKTALLAEFSPKVHLKLACDPLVLLHAKAAVVDGSKALIETANITRSSFCSPGNILVTDTDPADVAAVRSALATRDGTAATNVIAGPNSIVRDRVSALFDSSADLRVASEDLSDPRIVEALQQRCHAGHADRILVNTYQRVSATEARVINKLERAGVAIRSLPNEYLHEKYVDSGDRVYIGSANLTHNGLDEAREVGVVAAAQSFADGAALLRHDFDSNWQHATPVRLRGCVAQAWEKAAARFRLWQQQLLGTIDRAVAPLPCR